MPIGTCVAKLNNDSRFVEVVSAEHVDLVTPQSNSFGIVILSPPTRLEHVCYGFHGIGKLRAGISDVGGVPPNGVRE